MAFFTNALPDVGLLGATDDVIGVTTESVIAQVPRHHAGCKASALEHDQHQSVHLPCFQPAFFRSTLQPNRQLAVVLATTVA